MYIDYFGFYFILILIPLLPYAIAKAGIVFNVSVCLSACVRNKPVSGSGDMSCVDQKWSVRLF